MKRSILMMLLVFVAMASFAQERLIYRCDYRP